MDGNGISSYRVQWLLAPRQRAKELLLRARQLGIFNEIAALLRQIEQQLSRHPDAGADPLFHTVSNGGQVWRRAFPPLRVHFVVFEVQRAFLIHRLEVHPPHPLAQD